MIKIENNTRDRKRLLTYGAFVILLGLALSLAILLPNIVKASEESITVKEINYENSTITLQVNSGDTEVYFSDSSKRVWEVVPGKIDSNRTITLDISWITLAKNYVLTLKGDKSTEVVSVVLPKQVTNFKASFNNVKEVVTFGNTADRTIEWRKKDSRTWQIVNQATISTELQYLYNNGGTVIFRLAPVNGSSIADVGMRASKEITLSIPKKTTAPAVAVNGSKFIIPVKKGMAYRTVSADGIKGDWININSNIDYNLYDVASSAMYKNASTQQEEVTLQFRKNANSSSQVSKISAVTIPVQEGKPDEDKYGISLSYTSSTTLSLQVKAANSTTPFEYTIVKKDDELHYQSATWTAITSSTAVTISNKTAPEGSHIFIRKKSVDATETKEFSLASSEIDISGTNGVVYSAAPKVDTVTTLITTAGVCKEDKSSSYLTFILYSPTSTTVSNINLYNTYGVQKGSVTCKSTVAANTNKDASVYEKYIITTRITSTSSIDHITNEALYANITFANGDSITSNANAGVLLYLYPNTKVNNSNKDYLSKFKRMHMSNDTNDKTSFTFQLDLGTEFVPDPSGIDKFTSNSTAIFGIDYQGYSLNKGTDYTVDYGSYLNDDKKKVITATVTVNVSKFETNTNITKFDREEPLTITLNNNEILDDDIYLTLVSSATIQDAPIAWTITQGSLKETKNVTITNPDGTTSTVTEDVITFTINLDIFDNSYGVSVSDVTWDNTSIFGSATVKNGKAVINLSNVKINKLTTTSTDTKNLVITLSNGFVIKTGCKLTIIKG